MLNRLLAACHEQAAWPDLLALLESLPVSSQQRLLARAPRLDNRLRSALLAAATTRQQDLLLERLAEADSLAHGDFRELLHQLPEAAQSEWRQRCHDRGLLALL